MNQLNQSDSSFENQFGHIDQQKNRCGKPIVIVGPASHTLCAWPADKNVIS